MRTAKLSSVVDCLEKVRSGVESSAEIRSVVAFFRSGGARWLKWSERESTDWKVCGSNPTSASRLPLCKFGQPGSISALVLPSSGMAARHRKGVTAEQFFAPFRCTAALQLEGSMTIKILSGCPGLARSNRNAMVRFELYTNHMELFAVINTLQCLEMAYSQDYVNYADYAKACNKLLNQYKVRFRQLASEFHTVEEFASRYKVLFAAGLFLFIYC
ncbi:Vacuolar protein-sorting-associated protein 28 [Clonorchis sinensis]|uniref:Vacuolar protein-sorting-associated protein 28 n=1 Tax=Clonorchis sinensis TaxID=79923 RepID=A0A3R7FLF7_CLOSI|nr:Vacuolar protein-sorting-associated protein 28 [Clonorchis sinensis]